jgi:tRNA A37 N6-isopentenylltransferase MiaA
MAELREEHFEVIDRNKAENFDRQNTEKLVKAREIYNQSRGLENISEHDLKKFNELMKYIP